MTDLETLIAIEEIKRLKARYCRYVDTKQMDKWKTCFTEDCVFDPGAPPEAGDMIWRGRDEIYDAEARLHAGKSQTFHLAHLPEIEVTSDTTASAIWAMEDGTIWPEGEFPDDVLPRDANGQPSPHMRSCAGRGYYHETYEHVDGQWLIKSVTIVRTQFTVVWANESA